MPLTVTKTTTRVDPDDTTPFRGISADYLAYVNTNYGAPTAIVNSDQSSFTRVFANQEAYDAYEADPRVIENATRRDTYNTEHNMITRTEIVTT